MFRGLNPKTLHLVSAWQPSALDFWNAIGPDINSASSFSNKKIIRCVMSHNMTTSMTNTDIKTILTITIIITIILAAC